VLDNKAAPYGDGEMSSSKNANGVAVLPPFFVAAAAVIDGKRGNCLNTTKHTFLSKRVIIEESHRSCVIAECATAPSGCSAYLSPASAFIHLAHGPPESAHEKYA
jgi:hypothetical protein